MKKITYDTLEKWEACQEWADRFNELFPNGSDLQTAVEGLAADGHPEWGIWLVEHARCDDDYKDQAGKGFLNTGDLNTGDLNTGDWNTGHRNTGHWNTGDWNTGHRNTGDRNTGHWNTGHRNTGHRNTGHWNTGDQNTGHWNTGDRNTGHWNIGDRNTGDQNTGHWNTGHWNTGHWNTGDQNTGYFNTITPEDILIFNKPCKRQVWEDTKKPNFIYNLELTYWIPDSAMTDAEKKADPNFYTRGGQLRYRSYADAWRLVWSKASSDDKKLLMNLPNFDAKVFLEISGIDVIKEY